MRKILKKTKIGISSDSFLIPSLSRGTILYRNLYRGDRMRAH
jgi:hypothetical protein